MLLQRVLVLLLLQFGLQILAYNADKVHNVYQVIPHNQCDLDVLQNFENNLNIKILKSPKKVNAVHIMAVSISYQKSFENLLDRIEFELIVDRVPERKINTLLENLFRKKNVSFDRYLRYKEIQDYLIKLAREYEEIVTLENYGVSYENRNLTLIKISSGGESRNPIIFLDGGIHGNEWLGPAQVLYVLNQLIENPVNKRLITNIDWIIVPLLNPDGYEYAHTTDRSWRKTRSKGNLCDGVDGNRNFNFHWQGEGGDTDECSNTYAGPAAFSEPETHYLSKIMLKYANRTKLYLTCHTPLGAFLHPWGYTSELAPNREELRQLGLNVADAIYAVNGYQYAVGSSVEIFTYTAGSSRDWAYGVANISLSYTIELPPDASGGHEMPPENILRVVTEMFEGIRVFHKYVEQNSVNF